MPDIPFPAEYLDVRLVYAALSVFAAGLIRGFSGVGSALINAPLRSLIWGPTVGVPVAALVEIAPAIQLTPKALKVAHWKTIWAISLPALVLLPAGTFILVSVPADEMRRAIGAIDLHDFGSGFGADDRGFGRRPACTLKLFQNVRRVVFEFIEESGPFGIHRCGPFKITCIQFRDECAVGTRQKRSLL